MLVKDIVITNQRMKVNVVLFEFVEEVSFLLLTYDEKDDVG